MPQDTDTAPSNLLLAALPRDVYERLEKNMQQVSLSYGNILHHPGEVIRDVYFPIDCLISITITMSDGSTAESGAIGSREMVGINAFMGGNETTQTEYIIQVSGSAMRLSAEVLLYEFDRNKTMRDVLLRYTQAYIAQVSQNVACNRLHTIEKRCARWLLEVRDRMHSDKFSLTQEFISHMLGVRRSGVTETLGKLQNTGVIQVSRKKIQILDNHKLEEISCECHGVLQNEYDRLLGFKQKFSPSDKRTT
ncbi:MAG: Crp/Fnr family transcriptional regulator [Mojavia pulchra JT2-VF2]|uniref:Crp/Fnr family transcriptional regulator n=1 Tax=Mojavia pulchra JT2-VF2 TaxID=287848 RepID=A0A951Q613_9NOST|nr:Crp/Fnr family transcriptional regulator [Mojavia pulchra JT2-VF2]